MNTPAYIIQGDNIVIVIDGTPHTINKTHMTYAKVVEAIKAGLWDQVKQLINPAKVLVNYSRGNLSVVNGELMWKGKPFHNALATRIVKMLEEGFNVDPMVNFMNNLMQNPSKRAVDELYDFLEKNSLPITPDGCFLAYKKVREDFKDVYSGTMDNSVGCVVSMERNMVDDNRDNTCSTGLHFCSHSYLASFGGRRVVIVKINPADVVSIPSDYNNAKGRACRYEVIGEVPNIAEDTEVFNKPVQINAKGLETLVTSTSSPKLGSTPFYRGYSDGYNNRGTNYDSLQGLRELDAYDEGYNKGNLHLEGGLGEKYRYVPK